MTEENSTLLNPEDEDLDYSRDIRKRLIAATFKDEKLPIDKIETQILLDSLNALERVALTKKRIKSEDNKAKATSSIAVELAALLRSNIDPKNTGSSGGTIPELPGELLDDFEILSTESSAYKEQDYKDFKADVT